MNDAKFDKAREAYYEALVKQAFAELVQNEADSLLPNDAYDIVPSERHVRRMNALFAQQRRKKFMHRAVSAARRSVAAIFITLGIVFALLMLNPQVRAAVVDFVIEVYETFTHFQFTKEDKSIEEAAWYPEWLPVGFVLDRENKNGEQTRVVFRNGDTRIYLQYSSSTYSAFDSDNEARDFTSTTKDNVIYQYGQLSGDPGTNQVVWEQSGYTFFLTSSIDIDDMLKIAESVKK